MKSNTTDNLNLTDSLPLEQELREKLGKILVGYRRYVLDDGPRPFAKLEKKRTKKETVNEIMQLITQYGDTREREGGIKNLEKLFWSTLLDAQVLAAGMGEYEIHSYMAGYKTGWREASQLIEDSIAELKEEV